MRAPFRSARLLVSLACAIAGPSMLSGCDVEDTVTAARCTSRFDCAREESCRAGRCVPSSPAENVVESEDAATPDQPPADMGHDTTVPMSSDGGLQDSARDPGVIILSTPDGGRGDVESIDAGPAGDAGEDPALADAAPADAAVFDASPVDAGCTVIAVIEGAPLGFCTIGEAIAAASPGATVLVTAGQFTEALDINRPITVRGAGATPAGTILTAPASRTVIVVTGANAVVESLVIQPNAAFGIEISSPTTVRDVSVTAAKGAGVLVFGSGSALLDHVAISGVLLDASGNAYGVHVAPGSTAVVTGSEMSGCACDGIFVDSASVTVRASNIFQNGRATCPQSPFGDSAAGIRALRNSTVLIEQQTLVHENGISGIAIVLGSTVTMRDSESSNNGLQVDPRDGILLDGSRGALIERNTFTNNRSHAIGCGGSASTNIQCRNNTATNNAYGRSNCPGC